MNIHPHSPIHLLCPNIMHRPICSSVCVCVSVCLFDVRHISETNEAIYIKIKTVTTSVTKMQHVLITLILIFTQGSTGLNHEK